MKISKSKTFSDEYSASVVRIGEFMPIENRDRILKTMVNGKSIVVGKSDFVEGDVAVYVSNECVIDKDFLRVNNMFDEPEMNDNKNERGYINKKGRVRVVKLGGVPSFGLLIKPENLSRFTGDSVESIKSFLENHCGEDFDEINGNVFCKVYVPEVKVAGRGKSRTDKGKKRLERFKMLVDGSFKFHYDTRQLNKYINELSPDDGVDISLKMHGTSAIFSNIITNIPTPWYKMLWRKITGKRIYDQKYNIVYSSRKVIKNEYINPKQKSGGYYSDDVWGYWSKKLDSLIPEGMTIYGEIVGFNPLGSPIQGGYDYGCDVNGEEKSKLMVYRITLNGEEFEISDVIDYGYHLMDILGDIIVPYPLLYSGTLKDLYPDIPVDTHWHENVLSALATEKRFGMEEDEPMCKNSVPREGIVLRKKNDELAEAWKLKCDKFFLREAKEMDKGNVDIEMLEGYSE